MCKFVALWAEHNKMSGIVAIEQIAGEMDGVQLQGVVLLTTFRTGIGGLLAQGAF